MEKTKDLAAAKRFTVQCIDSEVVQLPSECPASSC